MAKRISVKDIRERIVAAGSDGVPNDPKELLRRWGIDGKPCDLAVLIKRLIEQESFRRVIKTTGDGKKQSFVIPPRLRSVTAH